MFFNRLQLEVHTQTVRTETHNKSRQLTKKYMSREWLYVEWSTGGKRSKDKRQIKHVISCSCWWVHCSRIKLDLLALGCRWLSELFLCPRELLLQWPRGSARCEQMFLPSIHQSPEGSTHHVACFFLMPLFSAPRRAARSNPTGKQLPRPSCVSLCCCLLLSSTDELWRRAETP